MSDLGGVIFCLAYAALLAVAVAVPLLIQRWIWWREDRRWDRAVDRWADAALKGTDLSVLKDCPDIGRALGGRGV